MQEAYPQTGVNFSDSQWRWIFGDEAGIVGCVNGSSYAVQLPTNSDVATIGSASQDSLARVGGFVHRIPAGSPESITIPAASGGARTDVIAARYDPAFTGTPGPVRLVRIAGTSATIPLFDATPPGVEDCPIVAITRTPGQSLGQATIIDLRSWLGPVIQLGATAELPQSPVGTFAWRGTQGWRRFLTGAGGVSWQLAVDLSLPPRGRIAREPLSGSTGSASNYLALTGQPTVQGGRRLRIIVDALLFAGANTGEARVHIERWTGAAITRSFGGQSALLGGAGGTDRIQISINQVDDPPVGTHQYRVAATNTGVALVVSANPAKRETPEITISDEGPL